MKAALPTLIGQHSAWRVSRSVAVILCQNEEFGNQPLLWMTSLRKANFATDIRWSRSLRLEAVSETSSSSEASDHAIGKKLTLLVPRLTSRIPICGEII